MSSIQVPLFGGSSRSPTGTPLAVWTFVLKDGVLPPVVRWHNSDTHFLLIDKRNEPQNANTTELPPALYYVEIPRPVEIGRMS